MAIVPPLPTPGAASRPTLPGALAANDPTVTRGPHVRAAAPPPRRPSPVGRLTVLEAIRRSILIVLLPVLLLGGGAITYGLMRTPTYKSDARLNVGGLDLTQQSIQGYSTAVQQLAVAYARAISAEGVVAPVARELRLPSAEVVDRVTATPVPGTSVIMVQAESRDPGQAARLADLTSVALVRYAVKLNGSTTTSDQLLRRFLSASRSLQSATAALAGTAPGARRGAAQTRVDVARLEMQTAGALYQQSQAGQGTTNLVQQLAPASRPTSDRTSVVQQLLAGGLLAGLLIGVGLAVARGNRVTMRRLGEP